MTVPGWTSEPDPLLEEALDWVVRLKTGTPTRADLDALQQWRRRSAAHDEAFKQAALVFRSAGVAARELASERQPAGAVAARPQRRPYALTRRVVLGGGIAAAAAYVAIQPPLGLWPSIGELSADYRTGKGEHRKVMLTPDVALELNTQTSVALRSAPDEVRVELVAGEASIVTLLSSPKPLVMQAGDGQIRALQAAFNARCIDGIVAVTCIEGTVTVEQNHNMVQLRASEQVSYSQAGLQMSVAVDAAQVSAWRTGVLIFRDQPLASVIAEVNRYRPGRIIVTNDQLGRRLVNGTFQVDKLDNFVAQVEQLFGARVVSLPAGVVLLS